MANYIKSQEINSNNLSLYKKILQELRRNNGFNLFTILLFALITRILICFLWGTPDLPNYSYVGNYLVEGRNPYTDYTLPMSYYNYYPPFFFELCSAWFLIFDNTVFSLRVMLMIFDIGTIYIMYLIGKHLKNPQLGYTFALFYTISPTTFVMIISGNDDPPGLFFEVLAIYFFLKDRYGFSAFFLGLGICYKIFPIFFILPVVIYFIKQKEWKNAIIYLLIIGLVFFWTSIPFLIWSPNDYLSRLLLHTSRSNTGTAFIEIIPFLFYDVINIQIGFISFSFSWNFLIQIIILIGFTLGFIFKKSKPNKNQVVGWGFTYYVLLLILMHRGNIGNWAWATPYLIIFLFYKNPNFFHKSKKLMIITIILNFVVIISGFIYFSRVPFSIFQKYVEMEGMDELHGTDHIFTILKPLSTTIYLYFIFCAIFCTIKKIKPNLMPIITILYLSDNFFYALSTLINEINLSNPILIILYVYYLGRIGLLSYIIWKINKNAKKYLS